MFVTFTHLDNFENMARLPLSYLTEAIPLVGRKAFNTLAIIGVVVIFIKYFYSQSKNFKNFNLDTQKTTQVGILIITLIFYSVFFEYNIIQGFGTMWPIALLALLPFELLFQKISRLRSSRNMIYLIYILICLLDSRFEERVKIFLHLFKTT